MNLPGVVMDRARSAANTLAVRQKVRGVWRRHTWREVGDLLQETAAGLLDGDRPTRVAVMGDDTLDALVSGFAAQAAGAAVLYIEPDATPEEAVDRLVAAGVSHVFVQGQEQCDKILDAELPTVRRIAYFEPRGLSEYADPRLTSLAALREEGRTRLRGAENIVEQAIAAVAPDDPASIVFTAGLTSPARAVQLSHRHCIEAAARLMSGIPMHVGANYFLSTPLAHSTSQCFALAVAPALPLVLNMPERRATVAGDRREIAPEVLFLTAGEWRVSYDDIEREIRQSPRSARRLYRWARPGDHRPNHLASLAFAAIRRAIRRHVGMTRVRVAISSGDVPSRRVLDLFHRIGVEIMDVYGFAEIGPVAITTASAGGAKVARLLTSATHQLEVRVAEGEIQVRASDGAWLASGDLGHVESGCLHVIDRVDHVIELDDGRRVVPGEIESAIARSEYVRLALVQPLPDRAAVAVLVGLNHSAVQEWADDRGIEDKSYAALAADPQVRDLLIREVQRQLRVSDPDLPVREIGVLSRAPQFGNGEITWDRRVRRSQVFSSQRVHRQHVGEHIA